MSSARFALRTAWRESRQLRRMALLMASVTAGVAALVAISSFTRNLQDSVKDQARLLLGADLEMGSASPFSPRAEQELGTLLAEAKGRGGAAPEVSRVTSFAAMAYVPRTSGARLVQVMSIEGGYPFYGTIETRPAGAWPALGQGGGAVVDGSLLVALDAHVGDTLSLGETRLVIRATVVNFPGDVGMRSALGPRVFIAGGDVAATGLLRFGSRARNAAYVKLPPGADATRLAERHRDALSAERVGVRTVSQDERSLSNALGRLGKFLGLVGLCALLLGGVGVASAVRALLRRKMESIAILRCLGATAREIFAAYLLQSLAMGLVGSLAGAAIGILLQRLLPFFVRDLLPVDVRFAVSPAAIAGGIALGAGVAVLFSLLPLLAVRDVSPLAVLRRPFEPAATRRVDPWRALAALALVASLVGIAVVQAPTPVAGLAFAGGLGIALGALALVAGLLTRIVRRVVPGRWPYVWRQGLANLHRPANQTLVVVLSLGFGAFLLDTLYLVEHNLLRDLAVDQGKDRPNLALFDIQPDQRAPLEDVMRGQRVPLREAVPIVPMRIASVKGRTSADLLAEIAREHDDPSREHEHRPPNRWTLRREYRSTYRDGLTSSERLVAGTPWPRGEWRRPHPAEEPVPISVEVGVARELGVIVGDEIGWDVQGVAVRTRVSVLRDVEWARFEPNFFVVFPEGPLEGAPQTFVNLARIEDPTRRARVQRAVLEAFPNVSAVDLSQVQEAIEKIVSRVTAAIRFMALFSVAAGVVVLLGAVAANRDQRVREGVLLKVLGATRAQVARVILAEYVSLGLLAAATGLVLALLAGWALLRLLFEARFAAPALPLLALSAGLVLVTAAIGLWSTREVFGRPSLESLRAE